MTAITLTLLDDPVTLYSVHTGDGQQGEIRVRGVDACALYIGEQRLLLVDDNVAKVVAEGGSLWQRFMGRVAFKRSFSMYDGEQLLARGRRHWGMRAEEDWIEFWPQPDAAPLQARLRGLMDAGIDLFQGPRLAGQMRVVGLQQAQVTLDCPELDPPRAAFLAYIAHRVWGANPYTAGSS